MELSKEYNTYCWGNPGNYIFLGTHLPFLAEPVFRETRPFFALPYNKTSKLSDFILHQFEGLHKLWDSLFKSQYYERSPS